jgi:photosystem II stability/assembly factor-like uncharacterized protein
MRSALRVDGTSFPNSRVGWATGTLADSGQLRVADTDNGGQAWRATGAPPVTESHDPNGPVEKVFGVSGTVAYLYGSTMWVTVDGGQRWTRCGPPRVRQVARAGRYVYAVTDGSRGERTPIVWRSTIGSRRWVPLRAPLRSDIEIAASGPTAIDLDIGAVTSGYGRVGSVWVSHDNGDAWSQERVPCRHRDGGATSLAIARGAPRTWYLDCYDNEQAQQAITGTQHHLFVSSDAGQSWHRVTDPDDSGYPVQLAAESAGYVVLTVTSGGGEALRVSADGGKRWRTGLVVADGGFVGPDDLQLEGSTGYVVGIHDRGGVLYRSHPPFTTWQRAPIRIRTKP